MNRLKVIASLLPWIFVAMILAWGLSFLSFAILLTIFTALVWSVIIIKATD